MGMDVYRDSAKKMNSVAAFVSSINGNNVNKLNCTKWFSNCTVQEVGEEFATNLNMLMFSKFFFFS